jgi:hypothetical protein
MKVRLDIKGYIDVTGEVQKRFVKYKMFTAVDMLVDFEFVDHRVFFDAGVKAASLEGHCGRIQCCSEAWLC